MKHTYEDYFNAAKEIFRSDAIIDHNGWYFDLDGGVIFGPRCGYIILQYDKEYLYIPYKLELKSNGWIRPIEKDSYKIAMDIGNFRKIEKPSLSIFKEECHKYLKRIKELQQELRELKLKQDF